MFTIRSECRLFLREGNADVRLVKHVYKLGLIDRSKLLFYVSKLKNVRKIKCDMVHFGKQFNLRIAKGSKLCFKSYFQKLGVNIFILNNILNFTNVCNVVALCEVGIELKYSLYMQRDCCKKVDTCNLAAFKLSGDFNYCSIANLSGEIAAKVNFYKPVSLQQVALLPGVTSCDIFVLMLWCKMYLFT